MKSENEIINDIIIELDNYPTERELRYKMGYTTEDIKLYNKLIDKII